MAVWVVISLESSGPPAWGLEGSFKVYICFLLTKVTYIHHRQFANCGKYKKENENPL